MILVIFSNLHDSMTFVIMFPSKEIHAVHEAQPCSRPSGREQCGISGGEERMCHWNARSIPLLGGNAQVLRPWELDIGVKTRRDQSHACNLPSFLNCFLYETVSARAWHLLSAVLITVLNQGQQINTVGLKDLVVCGELSVSTWEYLWMRCDEETVIDTRLEGRKTPFGNPGSNPAWRRGFFSLACVLMLGKQNWCHLCSPRFHLSRETRSGKIGYILQEEKLWRAMGSCHLRANRRPLAFPARRWSGPV